MVTGKVTQRTTGPDGQVTGTYDNNPYLNSIIYDVEFLMAKSKSMQPTLLLKIY